MFNAGARGHDYMRLDNIAPVRANHHRSLEGAANSLALPIVIHQSVLTCTTEKCDLNNELN
jgi:hypothetical protein